MYKYETPKLFAAGTNHISGYCCVIWADSFIQLLGYLRAYFRLPYTPTHGLVIGGLLFAVSVVLLSIHMNKQEKLLALTEIDALMLYETPLDSRE